MGATKAETIQWICISCARERGYRAPIDGSPVASCMGRCAYCEVYATLFDLEDLIDPTEEV